MQQVLLTCTISCSIWDVWFNFSEFKLDCSLCPHKFSA